MYYLAYGMNSNLGGMARRCPQAVSLGKVLLEDHALKFKLHADAEYSPGNSMECALWDISEECEDSLDMLEGYPNYYEKKMVRVMHDGEEIEAMIYYMNSATEIMPPMQRYFNDILEGYSQHNMDSSKLFKAYADSLSTQ